jgi:uncharacterized protein YegL
MADLNLDSVSPAVERIPVVLLVDRSESMRRDPRPSQQGSRSNIERVTETLRRLSRDEADLVPAAAIDVAVVSFAGDVEVEHQFTPVQEWSPPALTNDRYSISRAVLRAIELGEEYKEECDNRGLPRRSTQLFLFSDGENVSAELTDRVRDALTEGLETDRIGSFVCVKLPGAGGTNALDRLTDIDPDGPGAAQTVSIQNFRPGEWLRPMDRARPIPSAPCPHCGTDLYDFASVDVGADVADFEFCPDCGNEVGDVGGVQDI